MDGEEGRSIYQDIQQELRTSDASITLKELIASTTISPEAKKRFADNVRKQLAQLEVEGTVGSPLTALVDNINSK